MGKVKISVAIPIYNTAKHLDATLDSLRHQTMYSGDFEIICVNDCSTDNSKEVIENYRKIMSNIVLINRSVNSGGPSVPRNDAIDAARGEYIHFLDSDDFLAEEALERLYKAAQKNQSDVIFGKQIGVNGRWVPKSMFRKGNRPNADIIADNLIWSLSPHKMFKLSFLKQNNFRFHPKFVCAEDQLFVMQCYLAANVLTVLADYPYYFVVARGNENISKQYHNPEQIFPAFFELMNFINNFIQDESYKRKIKIAYLNRFLNKAPFRKYLVTSKLTREQKMMWFNETKRFIDTHIDDTLIQSLNPDYHNFLRVAKENDLNKLAKIKM